MSRNPRKDQWRWKELQTLKMLIERGLSTYDIADQLNRTVASVQYGITRLKA